MSCSGNTQAWTRAVERRSAALIRTVTVQALLAALLGGVAVSQQGPATASLDEQVRAAAAGFHGRLWVYAKNLDSGAVYSLRGDERVRTASTIKVPIMVTLFARVVGGQGAWTDPLTVSAEKKVGGSGILGEFDDETRISLRDALHLMITVSDNTATNLVLDVVTPDAVNAQMDALGLKHTRVMRKVGGGSPSAASEDPVNRLYGLGMTTPREMVTLLERLERGQVVSVEASREMLEIMKREQHRDGIGRTLYDVPIASKSGALDRLRSDVAIVYTRRGRIAMALTVDDMPEVMYTVENPGLLLLSRVSQLLLDGLGQP